MELLASELTTALDAITNAWKAGMKVLRIDGPEYKSICTAGQRIQRAHDLCRSAAEYDLSWSAEKSDKHFGSRKTCSFN